nr:peptidylprolyl isomerase [Nitrospinota bacterium]
DESVKDYYNANRERFSKPVLYRTRHILIATIPAPEKLEDEADQKKASRMARMINDEAKSKANEVLRKIKAGGDFIQLAKEYSEDEASGQNGGVLGDLHPDHTIPEIAAQMVKLNEGQTSDIFQSAFGFHILKLDEIIPSTLIPFEEAESDILNILMKRETQSLFKKYLIDLEKNAKIEIFI